MNPAREIRHPIHMHKELENSCAAGANRTYLLDPVKSRFSRKDNELLRVDQLGPDL